MTIPSVVKSPARGGQALSSRRWVVLLGLLACAASLGLYAVPIAWPTLIVDDFQIVFRSWTWPTAWANLWVPANEHAMPLGRITTAALAALAGGRPTVFLSLTGWHGPVALVIGMILLGVFVARERGQAFHGLLAMTLFGVSTIYADVIYWFSASFSVFAVDTFLLALLAAQQAVRSGYRWPLALCFLGCALAPGWFAIGILAGPLCSLYLLVAALESRGIPRDLHSVWLFLLDLLLALVPSLGSLAFLAVSLPRTAETIMNLPHYDKKTAVEAFHPGTGLEWACRSVVDNLAWSFSGVSQVMCPAPWVWIPFTVICAGVSWWVWRAPRKAPVILGAGAIGLSYWLVYSARANWGYEGNVVNWSRYHLLPQMGLALLLAGGWPAGRRSAEGVVKESLSNRQCGALMIVIAALFLCQMPRGLLYHISIKKDAGWSSDAYTYSLPFGWQVFNSRASSHGDQQEVMRRIEAVDALCREHHIDAATARRVLDPITMWGDCVGPPQNESNWQFLHGSDDPHDISDEEARKLLQPAASKGSSD
jgi:hypothetical protein